MLQKIENVLSKSYVAIRCTTRLEPAGGPDDKVFPPTYAEGEYAKETRLVNGEKIDVVLMDSVQSQANRIEEALLIAVERGEISIPVLGVEVRGYGRVTTLDAPHRIYDAIFRDSLLDDMPFRDSMLGRQLMQANTHNASPLFEYCPTVLLFGGWDTQGAEGGRGAKISRALVSEIVGLNVVVGVRTSSRIDPLGITVGAGPIYESVDEKDRWTLDEAKAKKDDKGNPKRLGDGKPSEINHSNIRPSITPGGVTLSGALHTAVLSLPQLRRLRFPDPTTGELVAEREIACRTVLTALALTGLALQMETGYDLRSRCLLVPSEAPRFEFVGPTAGQVEPFELDVETAKDALKEAVAQAQALGAAWYTELPVLRAQPKLEELVRRSFRLTAESVE